MATFQGTPFGLSIRTADVWPRKNVATPGVYAQLIHDFDTWKPLYGSAIITIYRAGTQNLARVFSDPEMTEPAVNPQTLLERTYGDTVYGKFVESLYTPDAYQCSINSTDQTGITRPAITDLNGEDASRSIVRARSGSVYRALERHLDQVVYAENFGTLGTSAAANTTTIQNAIGAVGARGGGAVLLPAGSFPITQLTIPTAVILVGYDMQATTLRSEIAGAIITLNGDRAGIVDLTLDGLSAVSGSIGIYAKGQDELRISHVVARSFDTNLMLRGGRRARFFDLSLIAGNYGAKILGHLDTADGDDIVGLRWAGGEVSSCITAGVQCEAIDMEVRSLSFDGVDFADNLTDGLVLIGCRFVTVTNCSFADNARTLRAIDATPLDDANFTQSLKVARSQFTEGTVNLDGLAIDVLFDRCDFAGTTFDLETTIQNAITLLDCVEDAAVAITGDPTRLLRWRSSDRGEVKGSTSTNTATKALGITMYPGETALLIAKVVANQRNGEGTASYLIVNAARRDTADLDFDNGTIAFTEGDLVVGLTSGASGYVTAKSGTTSAGSISLKSISGAFVNNEQLAVLGVPFALANGVLSDPTVSMLGSDTVLFSYESDTTWGAEFVAAGDEAKLVVTGANSKTIEWTAAADRMVG